MKPKQASKLTKLKMVLLSAALSFFTFVSGPLYANPEGGSVAGGNAIIGVNPTNSKHVIINQSSDRAVINWQGFNIDATEHTQFIQPSASSVTLNRVIVKNNPSKIMGKLSANGQVILINPAGIIFGKDSQVDVAGLVAATADTKDAEFMNPANKRFNFSQSADEANSIINEGNITAHDKGLVALIAPGVENKGTIRAKLGKVALASGNEYVVDMQGDELIQFTANSKVIKKPTTSDGQELDSAVRNSGEIYADGGQVILTTRAADNIIKQAVNMDGVIQAQTIESQPGKIILAGGDEGTTQISGLLDVNGLRTGEKAGTVHITGKKVGLIKNAKIKASGKAGGGEVLVGGDYQGKGNLQQAQLTYMDKDSSIEANATENGNGGKIILWSDVHNPQSSTNAYGSISAKGGPEGGDGGFIETSGHHLNIDGIAINASAPQGKSGTWLIDPYDLIISSNSNQQVSTSSPFVPNGSGANLDVDTLISALQNNATSIVIATNSSAGNENGNITFAADIDTRAYSSNLTINAGGRIINNGYYVAVGGNLTLTAIGDIDITNGAEFASADGNLTINTVNGDINVIGSKLYAANQLALSTTQGNINITGGLGLFSANGAGINMNATNGTINLASVVLDLSGSAGTNGGTNSNGTVGSNGGSASINGQTIIFNGATINALGGAGGTGGMGSLYNDGGDGALGGNGGTITLTAADTINLTNSTLKTAGGAGGTGGQGGNGDFTNQAGNGGNAGNGGAGGAITLSAATNLIWDNSSSTSSGGQAGNGGAPGTGGIGGANPGNPGIGGNAGQTLFKANAISLIDAPLANIVSNGGTGGNGGTSGSSSTPAFNNATGTASPSSFTFRKTTGNITASTDLAAITAYLPFGINGMNYTIQADTGNVTLDNASLTNNSALTVTANNINVYASLSNTNLTFAGPVTFLDADGNNDIITLNAGSGDILFNSTLTSSPTNNNERVHLILNSTGTTAFGGAVSNLKTLTTNAGGTTVIKGNITTVDSVDNTQTYNDAVSLQGISGITLQATGGSHSNLIHFNNTVNGAGSLTLNGPTIFSGTVGEDIALTSLITNDSVTLNANINAANQTYNHAVTLGTNLSLTGSGGVNFTPTSILNANAYSLALYAPTTFSGAINGLANLTVNNIANLGTNITTTGTQTYNGAVNLISNSTLTTGDSGIINFTSTINGAHNLMLASPVTFLGAVGSTTALTSLTTNSMANIGGDIKANTQTYNGAIALTGDSILTGSNGIIFNSTINGAHNLTLTSPNINFSSTIGSPNTPFTSLTINGPISLGNLIIYANTQIYNGAVTLAGDVTSNANESITFASSVIGAHNLNLGGIVTFSGMVDVTSITAQNIVNLGANITTSGTQTYNSAVNLIANTALTTNSNINFASTINGSHNLTLTAANGITLTGPIGNNNILDGLTANNTVYADNLSINAASINLYNLQANSAYLRGVNNIFANVTVNSLTLDGKNGGIINGTVGGYTGMFTNFVTKLANSASGEFIVNGCMLYTGCLPTQTYTPYYSVTQNFYLPYQNQYAPHQREDLPYQEQPYHQTTWEADHLIKLEGWDTAYQPQYIPQSEQDSFNVSGYFTTIAPAINESSVQYILGNEQESYYQQDYLPFTPQQAGQVILR